MRQVTAVRLCLGWPVFLVRHLTMMVLPDKRVVVLVELVVSLVTLCFLALLVASLVPLVVCLVVLLLCWAPVGRGWQRTLVVWLAVSLPG